MTTAQQAALQPRHDTQLACIRGHVSRGQHLDGCDSLLAAWNSINEGAGVRAIACEGCLPAPAVHGLLCGPCYRRICYHLALAPHLMSFAFPHRLPTVRAAALGDRVGGTRNARLPIDENAIELTDLFFSTLANYVTAHARATRIPVPAALFRAYAADRDVDGFRGGTSVAEAYILVNELTMWEAAHLPTIASLPSVGNWHNDLADAVRQLRGRFPIEEPPARPLYVRPCPVCDLKRLEIVWVDETETIRCADCHWTPTTPAEIADAETITEGATA